MWQTRGLAALLCLWCWAGASGARYIENTESFPGWKGELPNPSRVLQENVTSQPTVNVGYGSDTELFWRGNIEQVSWHPRVFILHGFLSPEECDHLRTKAKPMMTKSTVVDNETGKSVDSQVRTSTGTFFSRGQDEVITRIEKRISLVTMLPEDHGEGLQILHYQDGQKYEPHHDYFHDQFNARPENGGQRVATVLMYLSDVLEGGETVFPGADTKVSGPGWSDCALKGMAVKPRKGDATLFYSLNADGEKDPKSLHGSCPTLKGEKWSATKWIHTQSFGLSSAHQRAKWGDCVDADPRCGEWAVYGECDKNPGYMLSTCRKSCNKCSEKATA